MPNRNGAKQWLVKAWHDLSSAVILYQAHHFTDVIAVDLQQAVEKMLKSLLAYHQKEIPKTHDLTQLAALVSEYLRLAENDLDALDHITVYYVKERYPHGHFILPPREQIGSILEFAQRLFDQVCATLDIPCQEVQR